MRWEGGQTLFWMSFSLSSNLPAESSVSREAWLAQHRGMGEWDGSWAHLEVREVLRHKIVDLADRKAPSFTVLKGHEDEDAEGKENSGSLNLGPGPESPLNPLPQLE